MYLFKQATCTITKIANTKHRKKYNDNDGEQNMKF